MNYAPDENGGGVNIDDNPRDRGWLTSRAYRRRKAKAVKKPVTKPSRVERLRARAKRIEARIAKLQAKIARHEARLVKTNGKLTKAISAKANTAKTRPNTRRG